MASPIRFEQHSRPHSDIIGWLTTYRAATPGIVVGDNATVRLDYANEVQPDALLRIEQQFGGQSRIAPDGYLEGPPELIVEIAASSASYDMHIKRQVYQRSGVLEYLVLQMYEQRADWFILRESVYQPLAPDEAGLLRSATFPGLVLQPAAIWASDAANLLATLQAGLAEPEHAAFVGRLKKGMSTQSSNDTGV